MGYIKITGVTFTAPPPISPKILTIKHRLTSDPDIAGSYITDTTTLEVPISGTFTQPFYILNLLNGTSYTIDIKSNCGTVDFKQAFTTPCNCPVGFTPNATNDRCEKVEICSPPVITQSDYCLAVSQNGAYASRFARIYAIGFSNTSIAMVSAPIGDVFWEISTAPYWANPTFSPTLGVMNRNGVWIDSDCNGIKDALVAGTKTTLAYSYTNTGAERIAYFGVGADNQFTLKLNGVTVAQTTVPNSSENFKIFHIFPVTLRVGVNDFNVVATGDGTVNDSVAMVIYDNMPADIRNATSDTQLNILFKSSTLIGTHIDIATCEAGCNLVTTGGKGTYYCRKITYADCLTPPVT